MFKKTDIRPLADQIWALLLHQGPMSIRRIAEMIHATEKAIYIGLGWLARENKVRFFEKDGTEYAELVNRIPELYY